MKKQICLAKSDIVLKVWAVALAKGKMIHTNMYVSSGQV